MEYRHILTQGEINTGRLSFGENNLDPESRKWFEQHSGTKVAVFRSDGLLIKRSILDQNKRNSWRFNCGIHTFNGLQPGNVVFIRDRSDDSLEVQISPQSSETITTSSQPRSELRVPTTRSSANQRRNQTWLGEPLSFRGLQHSPINEQGIVFLFGMVCKDLGYLVEAVQTGFPDCEAK